MAENTGEFRFNEILVGNDGVELDLYVLRNYFSNFEIPDYLKRLHKYQGKTGASRAAEMDGTSAPDRKR